jgi:CBS domain-containing membrane protein
MPQSHFKAHARAVPRPSCADSQTVRVATPPAQRVRHRPPRSQGPSWHPACHWQGMYTVSDIMTKDPIALDASDDLALANVIFQFGHFRHLPVVRAGKPIGLVSQRDHLRAVGQSGRESTLAGEVMTRPVEKVTPTTPLARALRLMIRKQYGCLPVVDQKGKLVGIVTETDATRLAARLVRDRDAVTGGARRSRFPRPNPLG